MIPALVILLFGAAAAVVLWPKPAAAQVESDSSVLLAYPAPARDPTQQEAFEAMFTIDTYLKSIDTSEAKRAEFRQETTLLIHREVR